MRWRRSLAALALAFIAIIAGSGPPVLGGPGLPVLGGSGFSPTTAQATAALAGDVDCSGAVDTVDALALLRHTAGLHVTQAKGCAEIGSRVGLAVFGDIDCDSDVDTVDGLTLLRFAAGLSNLDECVLQGLLPAEVAGVTLRVYGSSGDDLLASDPAWAILFQVLSVDAASVNLALATPPPGSDLVFQMAVMQTAGAPWNPRLGVYITDVTARSAGAIDAVALTIHGRSVRRLTDTSDPAAPVYYLADGDLLYAIQSSDRELIDQLIAGLPNARNSSARSFSPARGPVWAGVPQATGLALHFAAKPLPAPCVASPEPDSRLLVMAFDSATAVPAMGVGLALSATLGAATPAAEHSVAPFQEVLYQATAWDAAGESLSVAASTPWGDTGTASTQFPVRHCLSGTWRDGPRVLDINQAFSGDVTAPIIEGTLDCGAAGVAFSGSLDGETLSGDDLLVCSPDLCYDNGVMDRTVTDEFDATVTPDGYTINVQWHRLYYMPVTNGDGDLVECAPAQTITETFQVRRLTFGH